jgi:uncharacterized membrane protein
MNIKEEEIKKEFQLERVILFTDAVFAIILTIMVLDLKLPEGIRTAGDEYTAEAFKELIMKFLAYLISFSLVAKFWIEHLKLFRYLKDYDHKLLVLNLIFLFTVTLFPFAVSLITRKANINIPESNWMLTIYVIVIFSTLFAQSLIARYLLKYREKLCIATTQLEKTFEWKTNRINLFLLPVLTVAVICFSIFRLPYYFPLYTVAAYGAIISRIRKKHYPRENDGPILVKLYRYLKPAKKPAVVKNTGIKE